MQVLTQELSVEDVVELMYKDVMKESEEYI